MGEAFRRSMAIDSDGSSLSSAEHPEWRGLPLWTVNALKASRLGQHGLKLRRMAAKVASADASDEIPPAASAEFDPTDTPEAA